MSIDKLTMTQSDFAADGAVAIVTKELRTIFKDNNRSLAWHKEWLSQALGWRNPFDMRSGIANFVPDCDMVTDDALSQKVTEHLEATYSLTYFGAVAVLKQLSLHKFAAVQVEPVPADSRM